MIGKKYKVVKNVETDSKGKFISWELLVKEKGEWLLIADVYSKSGLNEYINYLKEKE